MSKKTKILYLFNASRKIRFSNPKYAKDFLYFYENLEKTNFDKNFIELDDDNENSYLTLVIKFLEKIAIKLFDIPLYFHKFRNDYNLKILKSSDHIIYTSETMAFSTIIPIRLHLYKLHKKSHTMFVMGFFKEKNMISKILRKWILKSFSNLIFLSKSELNYAKKNYPKYKDKFHYLPFSVDLDFWKNNDLDLDLEKKYILFNGNDSNRDYKLIRNIIKKLKEFDFLIISNMLGDLQDLDNVTYINTSIKKNNLSDLELKKFYKKSYLSLIPVLETIQPSGQSVAIQSMANKTPVLMSNTYGFWDKDNFLNNVNIYFEKNISVDWTNKIKEIFNQQNEQLVENAYKKIEKLNSIDNNYKIFKKIIS